MTDKLGVWTFDDCALVLIDFQKEMFESIRSGSPINNGLYMARSTMLGIMGRMACYTGQTLTWDQCLNSKEDLSPAKYEWGDAPKSAVAKPGLTQFA